MSGRAAFGIAAALAGLVSACARPAIPQPPGGRHDLIVLLPDPDNGGVGRATVGNDAGQAELTSARQGTWVAPGRQPRPPYPLSEREVERLFGAALAALPPPPLSFTLFFRFDSEELTPESRALASEVLQLVRQRTNPEIAVFGHTDTAGSRERNVELGLKRANAVRRLLVDIGVASAAITVASHGEGELLVQTGDEVIEPRNRRVEVTVR
jgi:outer membrane protein OmpA-like peptidoglycan-associated protein